MKSPHETFMAAAIEAARRGQGRTHPNPCVGCALVLDEQVIATGFHARAGAPHAEVDALSKAPPEADLRRATLYVTLEPCCIHGRTPPCSQAIVEAGIRRVVVGSLDPNPKVDGQGVGILRAAGIEVVTGVLGAECDALIAPFRKHMLTGTPWVVAKWAMSLDGRIATSARDSAWITGARARARVHELRDRLDAIMVGKNTAIHDDPRLTCRAPGGRDPWRVVVDARLEVPLEATVLDPNSADAPTVVLTGASGGARARAVLRERGVIVIEVGQDARGWLDMGEAMAALGSLDLMSVLVEGGGGLLGSLFDKHLVDEVYAFVAPRIIGGAGAISPVGGEGPKLMSQVATLRQAQVEQLGPDVLVRGLMPQSHRACGVTGSDE